MFFIPEERLGHGAVPDMGLHENMLLSRPKKSEMTNYGVINWQNVERLTQQVIDDFKVQTQSSKMWLNHSQVEICKSLWLVES